MGWQEQLLTIDEKKIDRMNLNKPYRDSKINNSVST